MKTYKEMTQAVLTRSQAYRTHRRKVLRAVSAIAAAICVLIAAGFVMTSYGPKQPAAPRESRLVLVCEAAEYEDRKPVVEGVMTPLKFLIRVRDLRGVNRYRDVIDILAEEATFREDAWNEETEDGKKTDNQYVRWQNEDVIISLLYKGFLYLTVEDYEWVQDMSVKTTQAGAATVTPYLHKGAHGEDVTQGISINWILSENTVDMIREDPATKLSEIADTITVTVDFKDGTTETVVIDLTVDDEGQIYVTHRGSTVSK